MKDLLEAIAGDSDAGIGHADMEGAGGCAGAFRGEGERNLPLRGKF